MLFYNHYTHCLDNHCMCAAFSQVLLDCDDSRLVVMCLLAALALVDVFKFFLGFAAPQADGRSFRFPIFH